MARRQRQRRLRCRALGDAVRAPVNLAGIAAAVSMT
jgi:hypothetical protein